MIKKNDLNNIKDVFTEGELVDQAFTGSPIVNKKSNYGLCIDCKYLKLQITEFNRRSSWCSIYYDQLPPTYILPNSVDPISECSNYYPKGQLDLLDMEKIAVLIDIKIKQAGFRTEDDDKDVVFIFPKKKGERKVEDII